MRSDFQMIEAEGMVIGTKTRLREGKIKIWDVRERKKIKIKGQDETEIEERQKKKKKD